MHNFLKRQEIALFKSKEQVKMMKEEKDKME